MDDKNAELIGGEPAFRRRAPGQRVCSGSLRRGWAEENCQIGAFIAYVSGEGWALIVREL